MGTFAMPSLGADMEAGTLVEWLVAPGDTVKRGDIVAVVETQKGAIEIECFEEGVVERLEAEIGAELPVGAPLAVIRGAGEAPAAEPAPAAPAAPVAAAPAEPATSAPAP
ncbi:2-oxo acid dehydrogenase subunit E2, partial [Rhodovulum iodosum]